MRDTANQRFIVESMTITQDWSLPTTVASWDGTTSHLAQGKPTTCIDISLMPIAFASLSLKLINPLYDQWASDCTKSSPIRVSSLYTIFQKN